ncbi:tyrosine-type recombinase/integrase [Aliarcobacter butzleri]|uniref:Integrase n=1 Tax=Aliarcobacter butzleri L355 TaxID=1447263 RepID=A0A0G9KY73_9BACT|nr:integrase arm-type DNA-binding domain-containing protein [Aliarcobacter butzleri]KLE11466.1 integrase [Aliarcobacter butzleri L355]MCT7587536.1 integrase arm-type DNA-binding domain-containing protein [Aliarcobacter butzleri]
MPKIELLQDIQIKKAKPLEKEYFLNDGGGLRLLIKENGAKIWQFRYTLNGQRKKTSFKTYPTVTLKEARTKRQEYQTLINSGIDPINHIKQIKEENILDINGMFLNVANEWLDKESERTKESTHKNKLRAFEKDIFPFLKNKHIKEIVIKDIINIIEKKQLQAHEVATNIFTYMDNLFRYAVLKDYCERNILADIKRSDIIRAKPVKHFSKITDPYILKELIESIYNYNGGYSLRNALKLVLHIPLRAENLCNLKWEYINFDKKLLTIPRELMKVKDLNFDDFKMPLTDEVINILKEQQLFTYHQEWIFLGTNNRDPINNESPNRALQRMGFNDDKKGKKIRLHGFRGTFRSMIETLDIENKFSFEVKERALDHQENSKVVRAYAHKSDYINQLIPLMNFWSDYILSLKN